MYVCMYTYFINWTRNYECIITLSYISIMSIDD